MKKQILSFSFAFAIFATFFVDVRCTRDVSFDTKFDPAVTDLVALFVAAQSPTDELVFRDVQLRKTATP